MLPEGAMESRPARCTTVGMSWISCAKRMELNHQKWRRSVLLIPISEAAATDMARSRRSTACGRGSCRSRPAGPGGGTWGRAARAGRRPRVPRGPSRPRRSSRSCGLPRRPSPRRGAQGPSHAADGGLARGRLEAEAHAHVGHLHEQRRAAADEVLEHGNVDEQPGRDAVEEDERQGLQGALLPRRGRYQ